MTYDQVWRWSCEHRGHYSTIHNTGGYYLSMSDKATIIGTYTVLEGTNHDTLQSVSLRYDDKVVVRLDGFIGIPFDETFNDEVDKLYKHLLTLMAFQ